MARTNATTNTDRLFITLRIIFLAIPKFAYKQAGRGGRGLAIGALAMIGQIGLMMHALGTALDQIANMFTTIGL